VTSVDCSWLGSHSLLLGSPTLWGQIDTESHVYLNFSS